MSRTTEGGDEIDLDKLLVQLPNGAPQVAADGFHIRAHQSMLVTGPSGAGKSTLFRAIAGIWPFGSGSISVPAKSSLMMLPQKPYFPIGPLHAAVAYPSEANAFSADQIRSVLNEVDLPKLAARLGEEEHWNRMLSLGEQQRLGLARALLHAPDFLFLDEATASVDEAAEARLYRLIEQKLPETTVVSIGHRSTLRTFHSRAAAIAPKAIISRSTPARPSRRQRSERRHWDGVQRPKAKGRQIALPPFSADREKKAYFRLVIAVRSADSLAIPAAPHQLEPKPPGLILVTKVGLKLVVE